jgi:hypothetical protein
VGTVAGPLFPWITLDQGGNVYVGWAGNLVPGENFDVFYSYSADHSLTWNPPVKVNKDQGTHIYATIVGGDAGVLDIAWYSTPSDTPEATQPPGSAVLGAQPPDVSWNVDFAQIRNANTRTPSIAQSRISDHVIHHGSICLSGILCANALQADRSLLDFFQITLGPDGLAHVTWADNGQVPAGERPVRAKDNRIFYAKQISGASAYSQRYTVCGETFGVTTPTPLAPDAALASISWLAVGSMFLVLAFVPARSRRAAQG